MSSRILIHIWKDTTLCIAKSKIKSSISVYTSAKSKCFLTSSKCNQKLLKSQSVSNVISSDLSSDNHRSISLDAVTPTLLCTVIVFSGTGSVCIITCVHHCTCSSPTVQACHIPFKCQQERTAISVCLPFPLCTSPGAHGSQHNNTQHGWAKWEIGKHTRGNKREWDREGGLVYAL